VNKAELVTALAEHLDGDRKTAATAVDGLLDVIVRTVSAGDSVSVTGFGVFERRERAARSGRNPRTGEVIQVAATAIPAFRPGAGFRDVVSGVREAGASAPRASSARTARATPRSAARAAAPVAEPAATTAVAAGNGTVSSAGAKAAVKAAVKSSGKAKDGKVKDGKSKAAKETSAKNGKVAAKASTKAAKESTKAPAKKKAKK
jgi:DNA-binding protein HU-beta